MSESPSSRTGCWIAGGLAAVGCLVLTGVGFALVLGFGYWSALARSGPPPPVRGPVGPTPPAWPKSTEPENFPQAPTDLSEITVVDKPEPYIVTGASAQQIRSNLNRLGPTTASGRHDAMTRWYVRWSFPFDRSTDRCATGPVTVSVTITMQLPKWTPPPDAPPELSTNWQRYMTALRHHENGHKNHGLLAARDVLAKLRHLAAQETCPEMNVAANTAANRILDEYRKKDAAYDRRTRHGATQGARFP